jgi:hypothetical protein
MPSKSSSSSHHHHQQAAKQYYLITDVNVRTTANEKAIDPQSQESWQEPYTIDDADLMFDGKPLNLLYEENKWQAEHHVSRSADYYRGESVRNPSPENCSLRANH